MLEKVILTYFVLDYPIEISPLEVRNLQIQTILKDLSCLLQEEKWLMRSQS